MAGVTDRYTLEVIGREKGLKELQKNVQRTTNLLQGGSKIRGFEKQTQNIAAMNREIETQTKQLQRARLQTSKLGRAWESSKMGVLGFNGALLSTLFFGMELQRIFGGALKSIFEGYKKIIPESSAFNVMTTKLAANWEFFKFQLADALAQSPIFQKFIEFTIGLLSSLQKLPTPIKFLITGLLVLGTVLGGLLFLIGVWGLGIAGIIDLLVALGVTSTGVSAVVSRAFAIMSGAARVFWASVFTPATLFVVAIGGALAIASQLFSKFFLNEGEQIKGFWNNMLAGGMIFLTGFTNIIVLAITGIIGIFTFLYDSWKFTLESMGDLASGFGNAIVAAIKAGITGGLDAAKEAFISEFNIADIGKKLQNNFINNFADGTTVRLGEFSRDITGRLNDWNLEQLRELATPKEENLSAFDDLNRQIGSAVTTPTGNNQQNIQNNYYIGTEGGEFIGDTSGIRREVDTILRDSGLGDIDKQLQGFSQ